MTADDAGLAGFNALATEAAEEELRACCASRAWARGVAAARPYRNRAALLDRADEVLARLGWKDIHEALDAHPRIGERPTGGARDAVWSRREQSAVDNVDAATRLALDEANRAYEERFGHVFLIFATGHTDTEMLAAAQERLNNDETTERDVVRGQLRQITLLRLERLLDS
jgi:2-oxo-4-hydroxy-4-carboxy-5-ureidoimidazoline decarboxylase